MATRLPAQSSQIQPFGHCNSPLHSGARVLEEWYSKCLLRKAQVLSHMMPYPFQARFLVSSDAFDHNYSNPDETGVQGTSKA